MRQSTQCACVKYTTSGLAVTGGGQQLQQQRMQTVGNGTGNDLQENPRRVEATCRSCQAVLAAARGAMQQPFMLMLLCHSQQVEHVTAAGSCCGAELTHNVQVVDNYSSKGYNLLGMGVGSFTKPNDANVPQLSQQQLDMQHSQM